MSIKQQLVIRSSVLKGHVSKYAILGLVISIASILVASCLVSYQSLGEVSILGLIHAQAISPAIWALDLTPFMFAYWGQSFCYELASKAETIIEDKTRELVDKSGELELKLKYESNHDHLTNLPNNRLLSERMIQGIKQIQTGEELAIIILNVSNLKEINYIYGSFSANSLLLQFAEKLKSILLEPYLLQAYMGMNMVARLQGAGFGILIPRLKKEHNLNLILNNLIEATSTTYMIDGNSIDLRTTAGVALYPQHGDTDEILIQRANLCVLHAEKTGKAYEIYDSSMDKNDKTKQIMLKEVSKAIENEEMEIVYLPIMELSTGKVLGSEVMIGIDNEQLGKLKEEKLIPLVEGTSLVKNLISFTLDNSIKQLALLHQVNPKLFLTINLFSPINLDLPELIESIIKENNISSEYIKISVSEKFCLSDQTRSIKLLNELANLGIKITISDFCSGYSSFAYLTNFPISEIKIDKSFIMNMLKDEKKLKMVRAIAKLAEAMNLVVLADGISDKKMVTELKKLGCVYGQGTYFSEALNTEDLTKLITAA